MRSVAAACVLAIGIDASVAVCHGEQCEMDSASMLQFAHSNLNKPGSKSKDCEKWYTSGDYGTHDDSAPDPNVFAKKLNSLTKNKNKITRLLRAVRKVIKTNEDCWPQDVDSYGPLMIRLAWHCSGTYRVSDGTGGCAGGRMRFDPEASWGDNGNLGKARALLMPIKKRFGQGLSWGDLYILAGTLAIDDMGGPTKEFCFGRVDEKTNFNSTMLNDDCDENGNCADGPIHPGLIYVNPEGPGGNPDPALSAKDVRVAFDRMGFTPFETVALVGGGHAFGQAHGACNTEGCASKHKVRTSDFHGKWTRNPTKWDNEYFTSLVSEEWSVHTGSGGKQQFHTANRDSEFASVFMTTADVALKTGADYSEFTNLFAQSKQELEAAFADAWRKLTTNGRGWLERRTCIQFGDYKA